MCKTMRDQQKKMPTIVVVQISVNWNTCQSLVYVQFACCAANHCQGYVFCAHSSCPFILANVAEKEVARFVVGNDSGMYTFCLGFGPPLPFTMGSSSVALFLVRVTLRRRR